MDTWWWLALGAVVALSLVAALIDGGARLGRPFRRLRGDLAPRNSSLPDRGPRPGEIWWTREPLLVLVLAVRIDRARVARISAERPSREGEYRLPESAGAKLALPPGTVADAAGRVTALCTDADAAWDVELSEFGRRAGEVDQDIWVQVRHLSGET
ncbi:type II toxin-antitoxin system PemK/MazF family toxin [Streptomyces bathyalis]|uniref:Type II toxin-antitoxin system PemK/MazF family toxin n=1 Tax=Streptomyces bathyalis TaxID=2710756 RepID=A0A7T1T953_9ACTN|nr:type II toxin-antitoxin system PemK/MazF family toxin [Streptomyces bathyalis]QPP08657.1 type II toxin-antitoxin system PemK/MazF family toxin [Streptomyces bathyalis]